MRDDAAVFVQIGAGPEIGGLDGLPDDVRFADPGALLTGEADGDGVAGFLQSVDERVHVGRGLLRGGAVVVDYLEG